MDSQDLSDFLPLARGSACRVCRRRKIKCDGGQPTCRQCIRSDKADECSYADAPGPSTDRLLEEQIAHLESRIEEMVNVRGTVVLENPQSSDSSASRGSTGSRWWEMPEPPAGIARALIEQFLPHRLKLGFFLDVNQFLAGFTASRSTENHCPIVLRSAVYLWGVRISGNPEYVRREATFLARTLRLVQTALVAAQQQTGVTVHLLQAQILVANYFFASARLTEGQFHIAAVVSLAHACELHKLTVGAQNNWMRPSQSPAEARDRINAWWHIFSLEKSWTSLLDLPSALVEHNAVRTIDTPWPQETEATTVLAAWPGFTVQRFLHDVTSDSTLSRLALRSKAAALLGRSAELASRRGRNDSRLLDKVTSHDIAIDIFKQSMPSIAGATHFSPDIIHELLVIQSLTHAATICLHKGLMSTDNTSLTKCLSASYVIVRMAVEAHVQQLHYVDPILTMVCALACEVLTPLLRLLRSPTYVPTTPATLPRREELEAAVTQLAGAMKHCARSVPLFAYQLEKLKGVI